MTLNGIFAANLLLCLKNEKANPLNASNLVEKVGGIVVPLQDVSAYSATICWLLDTHDRSVALGKPAQDHVDQHIV